MSREQVLVTGAGGYMGGHLAKKLAAEGFSVRGLVRNESRFEELNQAGVQPVIGDLRDKQSLSAALDGVDVVYQIAGIFRQENVSRQEMWDTHVGGVQNLLEASIEANIKRYVHCSTVGVHGDVKNPPGNENAPYGPGDKYQETKTEGEKLVLEYMKEDRLPITIFRPTGVYGPGDLRFLKLIRGIKKKMFVTLGSGEVLFHAIYIDDLVEGIIRCGTREEAIGNVFILAGEDPIPLNHLFKLIADNLGVNPPRIKIPFTPVYMASYICEMVCKPFGINPPIYRRRVKFFKNTRWFDISKAKDHLGFQPKTDMKTGITQTVAWYRQAGWL